MTRADELRSTLARAEQRARYAERQLEQFAADADLSDIMQERRHRKLKSDWELAVRDSEWAKEQLGRADG
jgi:hypothetical protein